MSEAKSIPLQRLTITLKSGSHLVVDFGTEEASKINPQIETLVQNLGNPEAQDKVISFSGQRLIVVRICDISAVEMVSLNLTVGEKQTKEPVKAAARKPKESKSATTTE